VDTIFLLKGSKYYVIGFKGKTKEYHQLRPTIQSIMDSLTVPDEPQYTPMSEYNGTKILESLKAQQTQIKAEDIKIGNLLQNVSKFAIQNVSAKSTKSCIAGEVLNTVVDNAPSAVPGLGTLAHLALTAAFPEVHALVNNAVCK
jgi:hypothetical protein